MVIIGSVTLVPVLAALYTAWIDHKNSRRGEYSRLLESGRVVATETPKRVLMYLYISHFLSAWGDRMWQFAIPILFMEVFVDTLLPSATFSLIMYTTCIFAIPSVGKYLDTANRWTVMKYSIVLENLMIVISATMLMLILLLTNADGIHKPEWTWKLLGLFVVTLVCGGVGQVLNDAQTLAIERDWVVVIAGADSDALAHLNTTMRRIDLSCKILAPMAFGIIMDFAGKDPTMSAMIGAAAVGIWNLLSTPLEYFMTKDIYDLNPNLAVKEDVTEEADAEAHEQQTASTKQQSTVTRYAEMWKDYLEHPVFLLSFSFCSLYMTILSGGALNTAYLKWRGIPDSILGSSLGAGAAFGLVGTFLFPYVRKLLGRIESVAVVSVWLFWLCLAPVIGAFIIAGESITSDYVMIGCMAVSRIWLWSVDLAETQIMQEWIEPSRRGSINSMQTATYQFFYLMIQFMGIVFHDPRQFESLVIFSLTAVFFSAVGFTIWDLKYGRRRNVYVCKPSSPQQHV
ncbi:Ferroportin, partial [Globisporangium splendens]